MKRKLLIPFILLVMLSVSALAIQLPPELLEGLGPVGEEVPMSVKEDRLVVYKNFIGVFADYSVVIENTGDKPAYVSGSDVQLVDKDGNVVATGNLFGSYPNNIAPGAKAYSVVSFPSLNDGDENKELSVKVDVKGIASSLETNIVPLPVTVEMNASENADIFTGGTSHNLSLLNTVENNTGDTVFDIYVVNVLRDASGKLLGIRYNYAMDIGVPAGNKIYVRSEADMGLVNQVTQEGSPVDKVDVLAYIEE